MHEHLRMAESLARPDLSTDDDREQSTLVDVGPRSATAKIFVLDTSVILYDAQSLHNFEEHDVSIPIVVLEAHQIMGDPSTGAQDVADLLARDPALAGRILKLAFTRPRR